MTTLARPLGGPPGTAPRAGADHWARAELSERGSVLGLLTGVVQVS
ncbi:hypothetical protein [Amycolatopsis sp. FDAARGOS 1241]|nr:hypothetical protein [Amycolatopsis sp. FDAARGOS 1241]QRP47862.1 hypothetical protein I6J71_08090 [Amycolatopsis sp. FDAARGOS 1241]